MDKYSVLMSVYYKEKAEYLRLAMNSMMEQTVPPDEFLLICDGPLTEELDAVVDEFCEKYPSIMNVIRQKKNMGLGVTLNIGVQRCRNELIARMDSDDIALPQRMEMQLAVMEKYPEISVLGGQIAEFCDDPDQIIAYRKVPTEPAEIRQFIKRRNPMNHMTVVLRKSHVLGVGNYQDVPGFEDYFLWSSLVAAGYELRNVKSVCCRVRANAGLYSRRGGTRYFQNTMRVERFLLEKKLITPGEFRENVMLRFAGSVLLPARFRRTFFMKFLRKQELEDTDRNFAEVGK